MQQILNIVKNEDNDSNSLTVEVGSDASHENITKNKDKPRRKRKQQNEKIKNLKKRKKNLKVMLRLTQKN